ncbi:MAG TPA: sigma-70 family RNA polymerase sigma factor [Actinomycetes bacterium]|nr:sigma-70 family RNA polymerase sigma factor [Actinomycetes bacterium]
MNGASDEELLAAHVRGDRRAFGELVARHERRVYGLCLRMLGNRQDAEDATQEAFLAALRYAGSFRHEAAFTTWLFRIAVNAATDQARRRGRTQARTLPLQAGEVDERGPSGGDPGATIPGALAVQAALHQVSEDFRAALVLCDLYGFPHAQAAEVLEVPVGTVKSRLFRGRLALGELLAEAGRPAGGRGDRPNPEVVTERGTQAVVGASEPAEPEHRSNEE